jgi:hypothetical protein
LYFDPNTVNTVTHAIRLQNETPNPFTTASVLITKRDGDKILPLSQDILYYTPKKGKTDVNMSTTSDVKVSHAEMQKERIENAERWHEYNWDKHKIEGKLTVKNYKNTDCTIIVARQVFGMMKDSNRPWTLKEMTPVNGYYNKNNYVEWEIEIKAGETKEITYSYDYFYRH